MKHREQMQAVADAARTMQETHRTDSPEYIWAAGIEDALRWALGDTNIAGVTNVSDDNPVTAAAKVPRS